MKLIPKYILFVVSPSFGIVDTVSPVLTKLKETYPDVTVIGYFPRPDVALQARHNHILLKKFQNCVDLVGIEASTSKQIALAPVTDFFSDVSYDRILRGVPNILRRLPKLYRLGISLIANRKMRKISNTQKIDNTVFFSPARTLIIGDFNEVQKPYMGCVRRYARDVQFCGVNHGVDIDRRTDWKREPYFDLFSRRHCFLFSHDEEAYYRSRFGLNASEMSVVGVQKHDDWWLRKQDELMALSPAKTTQASKQVVLISRPVSFYLPSERKCRSLRDIRKVIIEEMGFKLLVKCHPKELGSNEFFDCLGPQDGGAKWEFVEDSVEMLSRKAAFGVCFYSGVSTDMIKLRLPMVEYLDLQGLKGIDELGVVVMQDGSLALSYRASGLISGVSNQDQLRVMAERLVHQPDTSLDSCEANYGKIFADPNGSSAKTVEIMMNLFEEKIHADGSI